MSPLRPVSAADIESLATGAWILGTGGGGSPYTGLLNMRKLYRRGVVVSTCTAPPGPSSNDSHSTSNPAVPAWTK